MTNLRKFALLGAIILAISVTSIVAFAASAYNTPAEAVAGLTGKTVESIIDEKSETGKTYGTIANEAGKLEEFKAENLEIKKEILAQKVAAGTMTQEQADEIIAALQENQANCDGTGAGSAKVGKGLGAGFGKANGQGNGCGNGQGKGQGGAGHGMGNGNGNCNV